MFNRTKTTDSPNVQRTCLICLNNLHNNDSPCRQGVSDILSDLFEVLCKYMQWTSSQIHRFNFNRDAFPFCATCRLTVVSLHKLHHQLKFVQKEIDHTVSKLSGKILLSISENPFVGQKVLETRDSSIGQYVPFKNRIGNFQKVNYYRELTRIRYAPAVRIQVDPDLRLRAKERHAWNEHAESEILEEQTECCIDVPGNQYNILNLQYIENTIQKEVIRENKTGDSVKGSEKIEEEVRTSKAIVKCKSSSETKRLNRLRVTRGNEENEGTVKNPKLQEYSDQGDQNHDSDYEPGIASPQMGSSDDDVSVKALSDDEVVSKSSENSSKRCLYFENGKGKYFDRVRPNGRNEFLFENKFSFTLTLGGKWECSACKRQYTKKSALLNHLVKTHSATTNLEEQNEEKLDTSSTCKKKRRRDSSLDRNKREFPLPLSFSGTLSIPPLFIRTKKIRGHASIPPDNSSGKEIEVLETNSDEVRFEHFNSAASQSGSRESSSDLNPIHPEGKKLELETQTNQTILETPPEEIHMMGNVFQGGYKHRIQKIGDSKYVLDDKIFFERVNNKWKCNNCQTLFVNKCKLKYHGDLCPGDPPQDSIQTLTFQKFTYDKLINGQFQCRHCKHSVYSERVIMAHLQHTHRRRKHQASRSNWVELELNKYLCYDEFPFEFTGSKFKCGTCSKAFESRSEVLTHIRSVHMSVKRKLDVKSISSEKFTVEDKFSFEKVKDGYQCCECTYTTSRLQLMRNHIKLKHINSGKFLCGTCGKQFPQIHSLTLHETIHSKDRAFVCEFCGKSHKSGPQLKWHKKNKHVNSSELKFPCEICGKSFRVQAMLNVHMKLHVGVLCDICGKQLSSQNALENHLLSHSKINNYECTKCGKKYRHYNGLRVHLKSHDGARPFSCDICGMKFTQIYNVVRHKKVVHSSNKTTNSYGKSRKRKREKVSASETEEENEFREKENSNADKDSTNCVVTAAADLQ